MVTAQQVDEALRARGLRQYIELIEENPATRGEVVLYPGGLPVYRVSEAIRIASELQIADKLRDIEEDM